MLWVWIRWFVINILYVTLASWFVHRVMKKNANNVWKKLGFWNKSIDILREKVKLKNCPWLLCNSLNRSKNIRLVSGYRAGWLVGYTFETILNGRFDVTVWHCYHSDSVRLSLSNGLFSLPKTVNRFRVH